MRKAARVIARVRVREKNRGKRRLKRMMYKHDNRIIYRKRARFNKD
jgi:hypothetical protein